MVWRWRLASPGRAVVAIIVVDADGSGDDRRAVVAAAVDNASGGGCRYHRCRANRRVVGGTEGARGRACSRHVKHTCKLENTYQ